MDLPVKTCFLASLLQMIDVLGEEVALAGGRGANPDVGRMNMGLFTFIHSLRDLPESANADLLILCMYEN